MKFDDLENTLHASYIFTISFPNHDQLKIILPELLDLEWFPWWVSKVPSISEWFEDVWQFSGGNSKNSSSSSDDIAEK